MTAQTLNRFEWCDAIMALEHISASTKNVAYALAFKFFNGKTEQLNPSQETVADYLKVHRDTVKRAFRELRNAGWLLCEGDGGRSRTRMLKLICPAKIIPFRGSKEGQGCTPNAQERGAEVHPPAEKRGGDLHQKGGGFAPPHIEEPYKEPKRARETDWDRYRFDGSPFEGLRTVPLDDIDTLNPWAEWLRQNGFPRLCEMNAKRRGKDSKGRETSAYVLPRSRPPETERQAEEARAYFTSIVDQEAAHHAAQ